MNPVPPLGGHSLLVFLLAVGLLLSIAGLLGRLSRRIGLPALIGELSTGVILGPSLFGRLFPAWHDWLFPSIGEQAHLLDAVGQLGVVLLVGLTGLQLDLGLVRRQGSRAIKVSLPGLILPLTLGVAAGLLFPEALLPMRTERPTLALFLGVALSVSAIPVIAKTLFDLNLFHRDVGQLILVSGTLDDVVGWLLLSFVTAMATIGLSVGALARAAGSLVGFLLIAGLFARPAVRAAVRAASRSPHHGTLLTLVVIAFIFSSATTQALGLEAVFGALVAGILLNVAGLRDAPDLSALRTMTLTVLAPLFFALAGLRVDLVLLAEPALLLTGSTLLLLAILGKFGGAYAGAAFSGLGRWEALAVGAGMNSRGIVELVVATVGLRLGVLDIGLYTIIVLIALVTSLMGPPMLLFAARRITVTAEESGRLSERSMS